MKKVRIITMIAIIYIGLILINTQVFATSKGKTINDTTRMREKASTSSSTVTLISINEEVEIITQEGNWYKVKYTSNGKTYTGYIRSDMLETDNEDTTTENNETEKEEKTTENVETSTESDKTVDNTQEIEIKEGNIGVLKSKTEIKILPLINSSTIATIKKDSEVTIVENLGNWTYIETEEQTGWVITSKLQDSLTTKTDSSKQETKTEETDKEEDTTKEETTETKQEEQKMYVSSQTVNLRKEANSSSTILKQLSINTQVTVIEKVDNTWSKVKVDGTTGYISTTYLSEKKTTVTSRGAEKSREEKKTETASAQTETEKTATQETTKTTTTTTTTTTATTATKTTETTKKEETKTTETAKTEESKSEDTTKKETTSKTSRVTGSTIVTYAKKYLGYKYVLGAASPKSGFDCSGLVYYVYGQNGYTLSRTSSAQASNGKKVSKSSLKEGDLVFFNNDANTKIGHVGIYIGGGNFIHAANPKKGVIITSLSDSYYAKRYVTARRIIN